MWGSEFASLGGEGRKGICDQVTMTFASELQFERVGEKTQTEEMFREYPMHSMFVVYGG